MTGKPISDVSLVAANYNNGRFLEEFINSILASTVLPSQIIIVDDGSTDESTGILKKYELHPLASFIYLKENTGLANALNTGIASATGSYIMRADPDDRLNPEKIEKQLVYLQAHPELAGVGCNVIYFSDFTGKTLNRSNFPQSPLAVSRAYRMGRHGLQHPTVMIKTEVLKEFSYRQDTVPAEDYDIFARMVKRGYKFGNLIEPLYSMRIHPGSISSRISFNTIKKTFALKEEIFEIKTNLPSQKFYYWHILNYRKYLLTKNILKKFIFIVLSVFCNPVKLFNRIKLS